MTFNRVLIGAAALAATAGMATGALAAGTVTANATATATIVSPVSLAVTQNMAFGSIVRPLNGSNTVAIGTNNDVTLSGGGDATIVVAGTKTSAKFTINAPAGQTYTPSAVLTMNGGLTGVLAGATPVVDSGSVGALGAAATSQVITYGGQFDVTSSTNPQLYSGTLALTISYP
jgi:hypothetical protein